MDTVLNPGSGDGGPATAEAASSRPPAIEKAPMSDGSERVIDMDDLRGTGSGRTDEHGTSRVVATFHQWNLRKNPSVSA